MRTFSLLLASMLFIFTCSFLHAEVDIPWQLLHQQAIEKAVSQCREIITPFSAQAGFPDKLPKELIGKSWHEIRVAIAKACFKCSQILLEMTEKHRFSARMRLGAKYFSKRFMLGTHIYPHKTETSRVHEFQCRDFANSCDLGLKELSLWARPEPMPGAVEIVWAKNARAGLNRVREMLPSFSEQISDENARETWQKIARSTILAGNEAGMTAARVGNYDFPAWRLKFAIKFFKAAAKAAVADSWYSRETNPKYWQQACLKLKNAIEPLAVEIDELLKSLPNHQ
jgi:hypothetical protein